MKKCNTCSNQADVFYSWNNPEMTSTPSWNRKYPYPKTSNHEIYSAQCEICYRFEDGDKKISEAEYLTIQVLES